MTSDESVATKSHGYVDKTKSWENLLTEVNRLVLVQAFVIFEHFLQQLKALKGTLGLFFFNLH